MITPEIIKAADILRAGGLVALPTETVYGLGADARNEAAVRRIFAAKERPFNHPLIVHLAEASQLTEWASDIPPAAWQLAQAFWPGPLTLILKKQPHVLDIVTGGQETVGLRVPAHPVAHAVLSAFGSGVAAPSANRFTHISPTSAAAVREELGDKVDWILDGGDCAIGLESTIVDLSGPVPVILRPGMITSQAIHDVIHAPVAAHQGVSEARAPGMHHLHYAPLTKTRVLAAEKIPAYLQSLPITEFPLALLTHTSGHASARKDVLHVQMPDHPGAYAHELYRTLRTLDHQGLKNIIVQAVPDTMEWEAIRDRLAKASQRS
ncbi:Threonylcarbamoyl-AMP synthase [Aquicella siphonis]|uniref:Threonylcarbamoyl-AMP synthase n=1 Tax=Aquicella siphonis TaxID=254247 RepID=A0A5E4PFA4_9COXI|nr:L-threonylcarbamoyladenylate synthase [Aquicella siphonis]VVC75192.1 Threonylcarbamoyl-AMP synthase [Aquicella siphonis]